MEDNWLDLSSTLGLIATGVLTFNLLLGILLSTAYRRSPLWKRLPAWAKKISVDDLHNWTAYVALALALAHPLLLLPDAAVKYRIIDIVFPAGAPHQAFWTLLGSFALYAVILVIITTQKAIKARLGFRTWKNIHLISYGTALLFIIHGIAMDPELKDRPVDWLDGEKLLSELCGLVLIVAMVIRYRWHLRHRRPILFLLFLFIMSTGFAQKSLKGTVVDVQTHQPVPGATITGDDHQQTIADENGVFQWKPGPGTHRITVSSVGYLEKTVLIKEASGDLLIFMEPAGYRLNTVQVTGWSAGKKDNQLDIAQSIGVLTAGDLHRNNGLSLENSLNLLPGVTMESRSSFGGQRIMIRGYGNNTNFNGQGVQVLLNNIPITDATGTTILDDIDFSTLGKVEVIKGPASSLYGAGIAGVVNMYTLKPQPNQTRFTEENTFGSYGLWRNNTRIETANSQSAILFNYGHQGSEGFRQHSASAKDYAQFNGDFFVGDKATISTFFSYAHSHEELAGEMDSSQFYSRIKWSDPAYLVNDSKVDIESFRAGVSDNYRLDAHFSNQSTVFFSGYTLNSPFAHGLTQTEAFTFGGRTGFVYASAPGANTVDVHGILGAQFQKTLTFNKSYNLTNDTIGAIRGDLQNASMNYNIFTEWKFTLPRQWVFTAGGSLDFTEFDIADLLANSANPTHADQGGDKSFSPVFMPRASLLKLLDPHVSVYADVSAGYTPPPTSEVINATIGQTNTGLKPESGIQYEIGTKGDIFDRTLSYQLAFFDLDIHNKIVAGTVPAAGSLPQYTTYVNAGRQQNLGAELSLSYVLVDDKRSAVTLLRPFLTDAWSDFRYKDFYSDNNHNAATVSYSNNKVAGVAPNVLNLGVDLETRPGFYAYLTYRYVDAVPYTFDNLHFARSYDLLNGKIGYRRSCGDHFSLDLYAGADNLTNSTYYTFLFFSGNLAGTTDPHFLPMPYTAAFYGGARLAYIF